MQTKIEELYEVYSRFPLISTDSRKVQANSLFFALKGDNFDGNRFANKALEDGAAVAVVSDASVQLPEFEGRYVVVEDTLKALQALAHFHRRQFHCPVIAITGSNGKTTTKELCAAVLSANYQCHFTQGNFNNHIGVPLTLLAMPKTTDIAIIEMGANHQGEIAELCRIAEPTHGLITNVGKAHLEGFGGFEGVKKGKGELYRYLAASHGLVFVNANEAHLTEMAEPNERKVFYKKSDLMSLQHRPLEVQLLEDTPFLKVAFLNKEGKTTIVQTQLTGQYNFPNLITAIALGKYFKVPTEKIREAVENYIPKNNRSQLIERGPHTYIMDAYNANPSSMASALASFAALDDDRKKVVVLGDMFELGAYSQKEHQSVVEQATQYGFSGVLTIGEHFKAASSQNDRAEWFEDLASLNKGLQQHLTEAAIVLLKGSRGMRLEKLLEG